MTPAQIKVTRKEALEMVFNTKQKINKLLFTDPITILPESNLEGLIRTFIKIQNDVTRIYYQQFNVCIYNIGIWLDVYAASFNKEIAVESEEEKPVAETETIHNENLKIDYRINFLTSVAARLIKYGQKSTNGEEHHALLKALDYCKESIGYLELMR